MSLTTTTPPGSLRVIRQWQSEVDAIVHAPEPRGIQSAVWLLALMLTTMIGITPFVHVDRVVSSSAGKIVPSESVTTYQALDPSIIKSVDVKDGQTVAKGQLLATLDATFTQADLGQLRQQVAGLDAQITRLRAEQDEKPLKFSADLLASPLAAPYVAIERVHYEQSVAEYAASTRSFDEKIETTQATIAKYQGDIARYTQREEITHQIETMRDTLFKSGASSRLSLLEANDARLEMERTMENDRNGLAEAQHLMASTQADRETFIQHWFRQGSEDLVTANNTRDQAVAALLKASKHQDLVRWTAPEASVVLTMAKMSVGSVLKQGDELMELAPLGSNIEAEVHIASDEIGFLRVGDPVSLKVDAFNYFEHGWADGKVTWISEGAFTTDDNGQPIDAYYKAHVAVEAMHFTGVPASFRLIPGMTLRADINVGHRSLFAYIMGGFVRGTGEAMREP